MNRKKAGITIVSLLLMAGAAQADSITHGSTTINMDFVSIGYLGNTNSSVGYGAVDYGYEIGKYEVTASQWNDVIAADPRVGNAGSWVGSQASGSANWYEAARFCNWLTTGDAYSGVYQFNGSGNITGYDRSFRNGSGMAYVLPTENEWYKAAYYGAGGYSLYANGSSTTPGLETEANYGGAGGIYGEPWDVGIGAIEQNATFDMMGNVWEWTEGAEDLDFTDTVNFWGGSYRSPLEQLQSGAPFGDDPALEHDSIGLRVAAIPEPGTISLMSLSTLSLFFTRSIRRRKLAGQSLMPIRAKHRCDTFYTADEWESIGLLPETSDSMVVVSTFIKEQFMVVRSWVYAPYKELDKRFWNYMVAVHERNVARRMAFKANLKKRIVDGFDAFLALILK